MNEMIKIDCISKAEIGQLSNKKILIVDVRSLEEFENGHIEGAINLEIKNMDRELKMLYEFHMIVTACGKGGGRSKDAADFLVSNGIRAKWLCGGTFNWLEN